ncbi:DNA primase [Candidatus Vallotia cooleyia]|uniref:DNA primase n=1 Tax=Candidatus Vallotiella adelgis TaxID=1177211 RepID=UPI001D032826|nr:DNA primase [Candidatus Vallotia cooleyia]UDG81992.1 DNA primase [Candidatus Vallotia cooleyia]
MIPHSFLQDLLNHVDITDVVGRYIQLKKGGKNFSGLCPFHSEKSPSFTVSLTKQFYYCFGCGANGTAIGFLMKYAGLTFLEAVNELAQSVGLTVPYEPAAVNTYSRCSASRPRDSVDRLAANHSKRRSLVDIMQVAADYYRTQLRSSPDAIEYLKGRGLTGEIALRFGLGYAPDRWQNLEAAFSNYRNDALRAAGLVIISDKTASNGEARRYDRFRQRIIFPIRNLRGWVIGFGARSLNSVEEPKYLNSPETPLFNKGTELYGLFESRLAIREKGFVLVVEGYMDVVALAQLSFPNAVATLGTACTPIHVHKLLQQTDTLIFSFDGDAAGRRGAQRALNACLPHAADNHTIRFLFLPAEHDPDSYIREYGARAFSEQIEMAIPLSQFLLNEVLAGKEIAQPEGRAKALYHAKPLLQILPSNALRAQIIHILADRLSTPIEEVAQFCKINLCQSTANYKHNASTRSNRCYVTNNENRALRNIIMYPRIVSMLDARDCDTLAMLSRQGSLFSEIIEHARQLGDAAEYRLLKDLLLNSPHAPTYEKIFRNILIYDENIRDLLHVPLDEDTAKRRDEQEQIASDEVRAVVEKIRYNACCERLTILSRQTRLEGEQAREFVELLKRRAELKRRNALPSLGG